MSDSIRKRSPLVKSLLIILLLLAGFSTAVYFYLASANKDAVATAKIDGVYLREPRAIIDFTLTDNAGKPFTQAHLKGHWTMLFFGFTNCGMVCPTTMAALNEMYKRLEPELAADKLPQVVMVSVDPDRDSVERMDEYVKGFNPHFIGARAEMPQIEALEKELHLISLRQQAASGNKNQYAVNHSAEIMVFNPEGKLQAFMSYPHKADQMALDYKAILAIQPA